MVKSQSLINGIGNLTKTKKYYDEWSDKYELVLKKWNYKIPTKCRKLLSKKLKLNPKYILDLACGTGLFGLELKKIYSKSQIYGLDISSKSLLIAKKKKIYTNLIKLNFEKKKIYKIKFDLVSIIGAMTYCKNFNKLFSNIKYYLNKKGYLIFSHRVDLWENQEFSNILAIISKDFKVKFISRPIPYLPMNKDFSDNIKVKLVLLQKR